MWPIIAIFYWYFSKVDAQFFFPPFPRPIQPLQVTWNNPFGFFDPSLQQQISPIVPVPTLAPPTTTIAPLSFTTFDSANFVVPDWHKWPVGPDWNDPRNTATQQLGWGGNGIVENQEVPFGVVVTSAPEVMTTLRLTTAAPLRFSFATLRPEVLPARGQIIHPASQGSAIAVDDSKFPVPPDYDLSSETPSLERVLNDGSPESSIPVLTAIQADSQPMELAVEREPLRDGVRLLNRRAIVVVPEDKDIEHEGSQSPPKLLSAGIQPPAPPAPSRTTTPRVSPTRLTARKPPATVSPPMKRRTAVKFPKTHRSESIKPLEIQQAHKNSSIEIAPKRNEPSKIVTKIAPNPPKSGTILKRRAHVRALKRNILAERKKMTARHKVN
ncbi:hypothetical protein WR25_10560 [Diploscapter pachys]|uniref:BZIP domain-containing protein n=1 Tax=Diploscapter pachys TaxID=2018661 RepID=A0A2A2JT68_9BILA|nr:hypothetical protein WR25_10560 [Diploscapter pachys]